MVTNLIDMDCYWIDKEINGPHWCCYDNTPEPDCYGHTLCKEFISKGQVNRLLREHRVEVDALLSDKLSGRD